MCKTITTVHSAGWGGIVRQTAITAQYVCNSVPVEHHLHWHLFSGWGLRRGSSRCLQLGQKRVRLQGLFLRAASLGTVRIWSKIRTNLSIFQARWKACCHRRRKDLLQGSYLWGVPPEWLLLVTLWGSFLYQVHKLYCSLVITRGLQRLSQARVVI